MSELTSKAAEHRVFLRGRLQLGEPKNLLFQLYGAETRVLPDELAELEPVMRHHAPELLG